MVSFLDGRLEGAVCDAHAAALLLDMASDVLIESRVSAHAPVVAEEGSMVLVLTQDEFNAIAFAGRTMRRAATEARDAFYEAAAALSQEKP